MTYELLIMGCGVIGSFIGTSVACAFCFGKLFARVDHLEDDLELLKQQVFYKKGR